jgi:hypothetical protein
MQYPEVGREAQPVVRVDLEPRRAPVQAKRTASHRVVSARAAHDAVVAAHDQHHAVGEAHARAPARCERDLAARADPCPATS